MPDEVSPYYPDMPCYTAPLRPGSAPQDGCICKVCQWARLRQRDDLLLDAASGPIVPGTSAWKALLAAAR